MKQAARPERGHETRGGWPGSTNTGNNLPARRGASSGHVGRSSSRANPDKVPDGEFRPVLASDRQGLGRKDQERRGPGALRHGGDRLRPQARFGLDAAHHRQAISHFVERKGESPFLFLEAQRMDLRGVAVDGQRTDPHDIGTVAEVRRVAGSSIAKSSWNMISVAGITPAGRKSGNGAFSWGSLLSSVWRQPNWQVSLDGARTMSKRLVT